MGVMAHLGPNSGARPEACLLMGCLLRSEAKTQSTKGI